MPSLISATSLEKKSNLYYFDCKNEFGAGNKENSRDIKFALDSFIAFAKEEEKQYLGYINLSVFLQNWNPNSKCNKITLAHDKESDREIGFYLNGFDCKGKKAQKEVKSKRLAIESFYKSLFPKENDAEAIKFSVSTHTTFFIEAHDRQQNNASDIIAAVTFLYDKKRENAMILWLGVLDQVPDKYKNTFVRNFEGSFRRKGFSTILIMTVIKWCKVINTTKLNLWLQVSNHSIDSKLFYEAKGFYYKGMKKDDIVESLRELLNKSTWIDQSHMLLYCCNNGYFNTTNENFESSTVEDESELDNQTYVDTATTTSMTFSEFNKIITDQIIKKAEESKASNRFKVEDSMGKTVEIDLNQKERVSLIEKIQAKEPEFDSRKLILLTVNKKSRSGWYMKKLASQPYIMYPARASQIKEHGAIAPETVSNLLLQYPMLKEYMKFSIPDQFFIERAHDLKPAYVSVEGRRGISNKDWLSWDHLQIMLNIFVDFGGYENVAIIPAYTSAECKHFIDLKRHEMGFYDRCDRFIKYKSIVKSIPLQMRQELLNKRLIVYVNCAGNQHWTCTFLFNLGQYIKNYEDCKKDLNSKVKRVGQEPSGYLHYDPMSAGANLKKPKQSTGLVHFLNIIYDHCWQRHKPTVERYGETPFSQNFFEQPSDPNNPFFCMKAETPVCGVQNDSHNCGIGLAFGIMRFVKAFNNAELSYDWVDVSNNVENLIIPSYVFHSIRYSVTALNHLHNLRVEFVNFIDSFSLILQRNYKVFSKEMMYKAQLASCLLKPEKTDFVTFNHPFKFIDDGYADTYMGMAEELICKRPFRNIDLYNHKFLNVLQNNDSLFYFFILILKEEGRDESLSDTTNEQINYIQYQMLTKWNGWNSTMQTKYFIEKDSTAALRIHMKHMDEFPSEETITNHKVEFYDSMLLNREEVVEIMDILQDNRSTFETAKMQAFNRFLVRLFSLTFNIEVPYCEVSVDKDDNHYHEYFVCSSMGYYPTIISYGKTTHNIDNSMRDYRYCLIHHPSYIVPSKDDSKKEKGRLKKFKLLILKNRNDEEHDQDYISIPMRAASKPVHLNETPYYINGIDISRSGIVISENSKVAKANKREDDIILESLSDKNHYNIKIVDVCNDGNEVIYNCYMLLKLSKIFIEDDPETFIPKIRKGLYEFFTKELTKEKRVDLFLTDTNKKVPNDDQNDTKLPTTFKEEISKKLVWKEDDLPDLLMQLWNEKINYTAHTPRMAVSKVKESDKKARTFDTFFAFKILALKYKIYVPILYFNKIFDSSNKDKALIIFKPNGLNTEINCWVTHFITKKRQDGVQYIHPSYLCVYDRAKTKKNGSFVKEKGGNYTYERQHCKSIVFNVKTTLKEMIGTPPTDREVIRISNAAGPNAWEIKDDDGKFKAFHLDKDLNVVIGVPVSKNDSNADPEIIVDQKDKREIIELKESKEGEKKDPDTLIPKDIKDEISQEKKKQEEEKEDSDTLIQKDTKDEMNQEKKNQEEQKEEPKTNVSTSENIVSPIEADESINTNESSTKDGRVQMEVPMDTKTKVITQDDVNAPTGSLATGMIKKSPIMIVSKGNVKRLKTNQPTLDTFLNRKPRDKKRKDNTKLFSDSSSDDEDSKDRKLAPNIKINIAVAAAKKEAKRRNLGGVKQDDDDNNNEEEEESVLGEPKRKKQKESTEEDVALTDTDESIISTDQTTFQCAALGLCSHYRKGTKRSNWLKQDQKTSLCNICKHYAHEECLVKPEFSSEKIVGAKHRKRHCLHCSIHEDGDRDPFLSAEHWHKDVPDDKNAQTLTVSDLGLRKMKIDFDKMIKKMERYKHSGQYCKPKGSLIDNDGVFFQDQEHDLVMERDYIDRFKAYKEQTFQLWGWPATNEERNEVKKKLTQKINSHNCRDKKKCKKCKPFKTELNKLNKTWRNGHNLLKRRFASTKPGLIHGIYHEYLDTWRIQVKYRSKKNLPKIEYYEVDTAYVVRTFGKEFAAFALQNNTDEKRDFIETPRKVVSVNNKTIQKIKYVKEKQVMKLVKFDEMVKLGYVKDKRRKPIYNESLLAGQPLRPKKKKNVGDQVGKDEDKPEKVEHGYYLRPDWENQPEPETHKQYTNYKEVPTGDVIPAHWVVEYDDSSKGTEQTSDIKRLFGENFMNFCINSASKKFMSVPVGANKESSLSEWPSLIRADAPKVRYKQRNEDDLCVPKAFASMVHNAGFVKEAEEIDNRFNDKKYCFTKRDNNLTAVYKYGMEILPKWLQLSRKYIKDVRWDEDIKQFDLFLGVLKGSDGQVNHAVGIFNNWIFDSNEDHAIPLSRDGLDYCVSTPTMRNKFVEFNDGFFFREISKRQRLKRKACCDPNYIERSEVTTEKKNK